MRRKQNTRYIPVPCSQLQKLISSKPLCEGRAPNSFCPNPKRYTLGAVPYGPGKHNAMEDRSKVDLDDALALKQKKENSKYKGYTPFFFIQV